MSEKIMINNMPNAQDLWKGIGGHFDSFDQILCEFIDNSISNFLGHKSTINKTIIITLIEEQNDMVSVSVEDSGTGIENLDNAFCLGAQNFPDSPLNEHGFGIKHALASANPNNDNWSVYTRNLDDFKNNQFKIVQAPYMISGFEASLITNQEQAWPGQINGSGTYITFKCKWGLFSTIRKGVKGGNIGFAKMVEILSQDLGFLYAGVIKNNQAIISIKYKELVSLNDEFCILGINSIDPEWEGFFQPRCGSTKIDLGGGNLDFKYCFGSIKESKNNYKYYKRNMSSSGLEIRINGRIIAYNLFKEVWGIERHNMYNHLLVTVDLISSNKTVLPSTRTSKNGLREGDPKFIKLLDWVRGKMPEPNKNPSDAYDERDLFKILAESKEIHIPNPKTVLLEKNVFLNIRDKIPVDLYLNYSEEIILYEGKKDHTSVKDIYQLLMYWDGCVIDGLQPTKAILISVSHPSTVKTMIGYINQRIDQNGKNYNFILKTWEEEGVPYPGKMFAE